MGVFGESAGSEGIFTGLVGKLVGVLSTLFRWRDPEGSVNN